VLGLRLHETAAELCMRILTAFVTVFVLGLGSVAYACPSHTSHETAQKTDRPWLPPDETAS
jgi:hypothetical protein